MSKILLVEDNAKIIQINKTMLEAQGYDVYTAMTLAAARESLSNISPDLIVLDIMLPDGDGVEFLTEMRSGGNNIPVLFLTAKSTVEDVVLGLEAGGEDYIIKPYDYDIFLSRIKVILRRSVAVQTKIIRHGDLTFDTALRRVYHNGKDLVVKQKQYELLLLFIQREGEALGADYLYETVWGAPIGNNSRALISSISRLRTDLEGTGYALISERNKGWQFIKRG